MDDYEQHPDPKLKNYVYISKKENRVLSLDGVNYYFRQDSSSWNKTKIWTEQSFNKIKESDNKQFVMRMNYIMLYCDIKTVFINGIRKTVKVYTGVKSKL